MKKQEELREKDEDTILIIFNVLNKYPIKNREKIAREINTLISKPTMITITCDFCNKNLEEFGGLVFSPPDENGKCKKIHMCKNCYDNSRYAPKPSMGEMEIRCFFREIMEERWLKGKIPDDVLQIADIFAHALANKIEKPQEPQKQTFTEDDFIPEPQEYCKCKEPKTNFREGSVLGIKYPIPDLYCLTCNKPLKPNEEIKELLPFTEECCKGKHLAENLGIMVDKINECIKRIN